MFSEKEISDTLTHVLSGKTFSKSTTANVLLKFLVESSVAKKSIAASDIGHELFGKHYDYEKSEANARVNMYHLRKKLDRYYEGEGKNDPLVFTIERGQYRVSFDKKNTNPALVKKYRWPMYAGLVLGALVVLLLLTRKTQTEKVWARVFTNGHPTTLYLSSLFGYSGPGLSGETAFHRDANINSLWQFDKIIDTIEGGREKYTVSNHNYVTFEDAATIKHFAHLFANHNSEFSVRKSADFLIGDIKEQNIIYLSPMRYSTLFSEVFNEFSENFKLRTIAKTNRTQLHYRNAAQGIDTSFVLQTNARNAEYALAAKFVGSNQTQHHMFFADHGLGLSALAEYFTHPDSLRAFGKRNLTQSDEFVALYFVEGKDRTNLNMKLVFISENH